MDPAYCKNCKYLRDYGSFFYCIRLQDIISIEDIEKCGSKMDENKQTQDPMIYVRSEMDLDSIEVSSSPRRKMKIYFNTRTDTQEEVEARIKQTAKYCKTAEEALKEGEEK